MLPAFLTTVLFSVSAVCGTRTAKLLGGTEANFWRLAFAALLLGAYAHGVRDGLAGAGLTVFLMSGVIGFGIGDMALFQALPRIGSRLSVMLTLCLSAPIGALMEWMWLGTGLSLAEIVSGIVILTGVAIALAPRREPSANALKASTKDPGESEAPVGSCTPIGIAAPNSSSPPVRSKPAQPQFLAGLLFGLLASLCQASGAVFSRKAYALAREAGESMDGITAAYQRILGGLAFGGLFLVLIKRQSVWSALTIRTPRGRTVAAAERRARWQAAWPWVLANGLAGPALGVSCYQWALQNTPTGVVLPIVAITPLVIIPFSYALEGERPTIRSLAGGAVAVAGAVALAWAKTHPEHS